MADADVSPEQVEATIQSRAFVVLMLVAAIAGVFVSLAAWCFLELVNQIQRGVYIHLPNDLGYHSGPPLWWSLPVLAIAGLIVAFAIERLPGQGGHIPANGLSTAGGPTLPVNLPGVILAALATIGLGVVLGPEAPLIALGSGLGVLTIRLVRRDAPPQVVTVLAAAGTFAAVSFLFQSPLLAAILMIEVVGLGGPRLTLVLIPGLLAAGIGSLVSLGMGSWTGLSTSAYALGSVEGLAKFARPDIADFGWTIALALAVALACVLIVRGGRRVVGVVAMRRFVLLPAAGLIVAGLAIVFQQATALRFTRPTGFASLRARRDSTAGIDQGSSTDTNNQRGAGPVQSSAVGPVQVAVSRSRARSRSERVSRCWWQPLRSSAPRLQRSHAAGRSGHPLRNGVRQPQTRAGREIGAPASWLDGEHAGEASCLQYAPNDRGRVA